MDPRNETRDAGTPRAKLSKLALPGREGGGGGTLSYRALEEKTVKPPVSCRVTRVVVVVEGEKEGQRKTSRWIARRVSRAPRVARWSWVVVAFRGRVVTPAWPSPSSLLSAVAVVVVVRRHTVACAACRRRQRSRVAGAFIAIVVVDAITRPLASWSCHDRCRRRRCGSSSR